MPSAGSAVNKYQYFIDLNRNIPDYSKNKKIYFFDPFIYHLFNRIFYFKDSEITPSLVESVAVVHFARFFLKRMPAGRSFSDFVYYWKNRKETDIIDDDKYPVIPIHHLVLSLL